MKQRQVIITLIGDDRPGIVSELAGVVASFGGNWEQSEMIRLNNKFAGILLVTLHDDQVQVLQEKTQALEQSGLSVQLSFTEQKHRTETPPQTLQLTATDRVGIVEHVSRTLADASVNVESLKTNVTDAPHAGGRIFQATFVLSATNEDAYKQCIEKLEDIAPDVMVDYQP